MFDLRYLCLLTLVSPLLLPGCAPSRSDTPVGYTPKTGESLSGKGQALLQAKQQEIKEEKAKADAAKALEEAKAKAKLKDPALAVRVHPERPIRLGGVFVYGLGDGPDPMEDSAHTGTKISDNNRDWVAANCDVAAFNAINIVPDTFRVMTRAQPVFTPLLYAYASTLFEQPEHRGSVGGWQPAMSDWTLRDEKGIEVPHPDKGGHWMDFGSETWATHWQANAIKQVGIYGAQGIVAAELPIGNTFVPDTLQKYKNPADRLAATSQWLHTARAPGQFLLIPSAVGFDALAGHVTQPLPIGTQEPELSGRIWDELFPLINGAWVEGWVTPYWSGEPLPDAQWELHVEAADRADRNDQVLIVCAAYHNDDELEYALASFLMGYHKQGRCCFQPMPLRAGQPADAGLSLAVFRKEITTKVNFFSPALGAALQERHPIRVEGGDVWRRVFQGGDIYVNSDDNRAKTLRFSGPLRRLNGKVIRQITLPPHSGVILLHMEEGKSS